LTASRISRKAPSVTSKLPCFQGALWFQWTSLVGRHIGINVGDITPIFVPDMPLHLFFHHFQHEDQ